MKNSAIAKEIVSSLLFLVNSFWGQSIFASGPSSATTWPNEHCIRYPDTHITDYMWVGQTSNYYYRGLLLFGTSEVPDNSIITGHDAFYISLLGTPPSEDFNVRAMEIEKNPWPGKTTPQDLWNDCGEGTVYK